MWILREVGQIHLGSSEIWCWRRMAIIWTDHVKNEVLQRVKEGRKE